MNLAKLSYFFLPPLVFRLLADVRRRRQKRTDLNVRQLTMDLAALKSKGLGYFFDERLVAEFCEYLQQDEAANRPVATQRRENQQYLDQLIGKGYCVIAGAVARETATQWHDVLKERMDGAQRRCDELAAIHGLASMKNIQESYQGNKTNFELVSGVVRLWDAHVTFPQLRGFHQHETILDIVGSYFGGNLNESSVYVEYKSKVGRFDPNIHYHTDSAFRLLKVWLLLNDVGAGNGPLVYCEKTQQMNDWRMLRDLLEFSKYNKKYRASYSHYNRLELAHLANDFPELCAHEKQVVGKAGDVIIADTRGIHGGTTLLEGYRLQLGMVFTGLGNHSIDAVPESVRKLSRDSL